MNFYKTLGLKNSRIDVADALRGLAVAGIILYHSVEHFNMYDGSIAHAYTRWGVMIGWQMCWHCCCRERCMASLPCSSD